MDKNILFFKIFNKDLSYLPDNTIKTLILSKNKFNNRIIREFEFFYKYPKFNTKFYQSSYPDLKNLQYIELLRHYHFHGIHEKRFCNENLYYLGKKQINDKVIKNDKVILSYLDINFYRNFYKDIRHFNSGRIAFLEKF